MNHSIHAQSTAHQKAVISFKETNTSFGITTETADVLPSPADLFLGAFAACVLKNVERFSGFMKFTYSKAEIEVTSTRLEKPPRMDEIHYTLRIYSNDEKINIVLLKKNLEKFGTIYNTVKLSSKIEGEIRVINE
jgi:uncharacterized OsmC-like protein